jgi:tripartite-type tricarboxylate transporter receptor subunit TctC
MDALLGRPNYLHVPYKGTAEQMLALASGQVMAGINSSGFAPYVDSGGCACWPPAMRSRSRRWPQVPTLKELGHPIVANSRYGLVGPARPGARDGAAPA